MSVIPTNELLDFAHSVVWVIGITILATAAIFCVVVAITVCRTAAVLSNVVIEKLEARIARWNR